MHLGADAITAECAAITFGAATLGLGWGWRDARRSSLVNHRLPLAATLGAFVMAAQAWNVPVLTGTSGHLVGGVLLAWVLGPGLAIWTMASVLLLQAVLLGDGSLLAWGANTLNMGIAPALCVAVVRSLFGDKLDSRQEMMVASMTAGVSVVIAAGLLCGEVALGRAGHEAPLAAFCQQMLGMHLVIGGLEAALTLPLVALLLPLTRSKQALIAPRVATLALTAMLLVPLSLWASSQWPDGYETAAVATGWNSLLGESVALVGGLSESFGLCLAIILASIMATFFTRLATPKLAAQIAPRS